MASAVNMNAVADHLLGFNVAAAYDRRVCGITRVLQSSAVIDRRYRSGVLTVLLLACGVFSARAADEPRGGRVGWARLNTGSTYWQRHATHDRVLSDFIRAQTSLNMDPEWQAADPADLSQLCQYPLLFTNDLRDVRDEFRRGHLQEYVRRGGFLIVDACTNPTVTGDPDAFLAQHRKLMDGLVAGAEVRMLPENHEIYRCYFAMRETPPHAFMHKTYDPKWAKHGLYGVFSKDRMVAIITLAGLQCGWAQTMPAGHDLEAMKMLVNIYVYVMTR